MSLALNEDHAQAMHTMSIKLELLEKKMKVLDLQQQQGNDKSVEINQLKLMSFFSFMLNNIVC